MRLIVFEDKNFKKEGNVKVSISQYLLAKTFRPRGYIIAK